MTGIAMLDDFLVRGLLGAIGVALVAGPLGCFVVWQRMSYFGAAIAHSALLGTALGFAFSIDPLIGILTVGALFALGLSILQRRTRLATDTLLGIFAHATLAFGVIAIGFMENLRANLTGYLFGDVLAVTRTDLAMIYIGGGIVLVGLAMIWRSLLVVTVNEDLARAEGIAAGRTRLVFTLLLATTIAIAMKIVGLLLIVSLLIVPAAAVRVARSPGSMAVLAAMIGVVAVAGGFGASLEWDMPTGPAIVATAFILFCLSRFFALRFPARQGAEETVKLPRQSLR